MAATVVSPDPVLGDALATALMLTEPDKFHKFMEEMGVEHALIVDADGEIRLTAKMRERVNLFDERN